MILYWDGIVANKELAEKYKSVLQKIIEGNYKEANLDLKKLPNHKVFSVRVNDSDRLLFTIVKGQDKLSYLLLLGEVKNHDYHKSPFLKASVLTAFLEKNVADILKDAAINEESFKIYTENLFEAVEQNLDEPCRPLSFYNKHFIQFNDTQQSVLTSSLPLVISGAGGSGKSCLAFSLLSFQNGKRLYVTQSKPLASQMKHFWDEGPYEQNDVTFNT